MYLITSYDKAENDIGRKADKNRKIYNGMLKTASKYTVRGFLWYQGESNVGHPDYAKRLATMVEHWRGLWGQGELPFYLVEIAPYEYGEGDQAAYLR